MIIERIDLYEYFGIERKSAAGGFLNVYARTLLEELRPKTRPAILVIPGGAYFHLSGREGEPVALEFLAKGYNAFVLEYSLDTPYPVPLDEACMAVSFIRSTAERLATDSGHVAAVGFSAGGHLTGLLATLTQEEAAGKFARNARPDAVILSYPVVTTGEYSHEGSCRVITGGKKELYGKLSVEKRANTDSAPAFIWHTEEDAAVPVENSLLLASAYRKAGVPFALHIFEKGWHGLSLSNEETSNQTEEDARLAHVGKWFNLAVDWLAARGFGVKQEK